MTTVTFFKQDNKYVGLKCVGHTGFQESGLDVLCASISSIVQTGALGLIKSVGVNLKLKRNAKIGFLEYNLPKSLEVEKFEKSQTIFETMFLGIEDLTKGYSKFIKLEVIDYDVY